MSLKVAKPTGAKVTLAKPTGARVRLRSSWAPADPDAAAYITAVETADGQALEEKTRIAIDDFVLGCKADGIWTAIKASCILAGARTLSGALVPLVGAAPTNVNFVSGDYNRKTGLVGDGSTKYLNSNRNHNADPQNSYHHAVFCTANPSPQTFTGLISGTVSSAGTTQLTSTGGRQRSNTIADSTLTAVAPTLVGCSRSANTAYTYRTNVTSQLISLTSQAPPNDNVSIFAAKGNNIYSTSRLAFYSIGESLDLALLDARVTALVNTFATVLP